MNVQMNFRGWTQVKKFCNLYKFPALTLMIMPTVHGLSFGKSQKEVPKVLSEEDKVIEEAKKLYDQNEMMSLYDLLVKYKDCNNDEILWRLARAACDKGKILGGKEREKFMYEGFEYVKKALELNPENSACHKWYAIMLDYIGGYEGTKKRISNAYTIKEHFLKAIELNPKDPTCYYSLGYWCFLFADLSRFERTIASTLLASPPNSTYNEALEFFLGAEKIDPSFYSMNLLMIGKTYYRMKNYDKAKEYLLKARDYPVKTPDDKDAHKEAVDLLKSLGVKS